MPVIFTMRYNGTLLKMESGLENPVEYELPIGNELVFMNNFIGKYIVFKWEKEIYCIACGRKINKSFALGQFPTLMKLAKVIPIFKAGIVTDVNNYRPISLLPIFSKILEKTKN